MPRYRLTVEYDGAGFVGWQRQANGPSVQAALEAAVLALSSEEITVTGAGRTDSGVHALGQVAHFDLQKTFSAHKLRDALNFHLKPAAIAVIDAHVVLSEFHARFSAVRREYLYRILSRRSPPALERGRVWHVVRALDVDSMVAGAQLLLGKHDFTTFRSSECQANSPVKTLDLLDVRRVGEELHVRARARSFLHNQVRSIVGSLKLVGEGRWRPRDLSDALKAHDRARCGPVAPPEGLYLTKVEY